jgi:hypothetical protein
MNKFLTFIMAILLPFMAINTPYAATSALDNLIGGAGIVYWQAGGGWQTLINIQESDLAICASVHVGFYDMNGIKITSFNLPLLPGDNVGIVVQGNGTDIQMFDYSDHAYGGAAILNDFNTGLPLNISATADTDGIQRGYMSFVRTNTDCAGPLGSPSGNISGTFAVVNSNIVVHAAIINLNNALAFNGIMFQGFANYGAIRESLDFVNTTLTPNTPPDACDFNGDGDTTDVFSIVDDVGADIDFVELFLSDNITIPGPLDLPPWIICNPVNRVFKALGTDAQYWGRYNENPSTGTETILIIVAPQSNHLSASRFSRNLLLFLYNDDGMAISASFFPSVVDAVHFGSEISGPSTAGDFRFTSSAPIFGFTFIETASFADLYPLVRGQIAITTLNRDNIDDAIDVITLP